MYEPGVAEYTLEDALRLSLENYLIKNLVAVKVIKGLKGTEGECIKNSLKYDKSRIVIGFSVFSGDTLINTIGIIVHAVNYNTQGELVDNTELEDYTFYEYKRYYEELTEDKLRESLVDLHEAYKEKAIDNFPNMYKDIKKGAFSFGI